MLREKDLNTHKPYVQCAALMIHCELRTEPPHRWTPLYNMLPCQFQKFASASWPPTIFDGSWLPGLAFGMPHPAGFTVVASFAPCEYAMANTAANTRITLNIFFTLACFLIVFFVNYFYFLIVFFLEFLINIFANIYTRLVSILQMVFSFSEWDCKFCFSILVPLIFSFSTVM